jgi:TPP-dependent pyruvate/acetoin dehydrogenase alpha subunit
MATKVQVEPMAVLDRDSLGGGGLPLPAGALRGHYRQMLLLRRLDALFHELGRAGLVPFAWPSRGLEAISAGTAAALLPEDWVYPDLRSWGVALLRGYPLEEHLHQLLGTGRDKGCGRRLPGLPGWAEGHVVCLSAGLGQRPHQALGTAWASRRAGAQAVAACYLGPSELERPEPLDALERASELGAPLFAVLTGPRSVTDRWMWLLSDHGIAHAFADGGDLFSVLSVAGKLALAARSEGQPAALVCLEPSACERPGAHPDEQRDLDPLERLAHALHAAGELTPAQDGEIRRDVRSRVARAVGEVLGAAAAHPLLQRLDTHEA